MKHRYQSFTRIGRQFQSLERQVYADWTSVSFPFCQRSCLIWRTMTNTLTNTMTNTYVVIFLSVSIFGRGYHSRYQNFEFTDGHLLAKNMAAKHVHAICTRHLHTPFAYAIKKTPYAFFAKITLCMLYSVAWFTLVARIGDVFFWLM